MRSLRLVLLVTLSGLAAFCSAAAGRTHRRLHVLALVHRHGGEDGVVHGDDERQRPPVLLDTAGDVPPVYGAPKPATVSQQYLKPGVFVISLRVVEPSSQSSTTVTHNVTVVAPKVNFACAPSCTVPAGSTVQFTANSDAMSPAYAWNLSDESPPTYADATGAVVRKAYPVAGTYTVDVRMTDAATGLVSTATHQVTVTPARVPLAAHGRVHGARRRQERPDVHRGAHALRRPRDGVPAGDRVIEYRWNFTRDKHFDADTGGNPVAVHRYSHPGRYHVTLEVIADTPGGRTTRSTVTHDFTILASTAGCADVLRRGFLEFLTGCIHDDNGVYTMSLDGDGVGFAGLNLTSSSPRAQLILDTTGTDRHGENPDHRWVLTSNAPVTIAIENAPNGTIDLDTIDLQDHPVILPFGADAPDQNAPGLRVFTFQVSGECSAHAGVPPTVLRNAPGQLPAHRLHLRLPGPAASRTPAWPSRGSSSSPRRSTSPGTSRSRAMRPGSISTRSASKCRTCRSRGRHRVALALLFAAGSRHPRHERLGGRGASPARHAAAHHGRSERPLRQRGFQRVHLALDGSVPLGPVILNHLAGDLGVNPFTIGGGIGGQIGPLGVAADIDYTSAYRGAPWHFALSNVNVSYLNIIQAGGALDLYGDGFVGGEVHVRFAFPSLSARSPIVSAQGYVRGWFMPPNPPSVPQSQYQISGGVAVDVNAFLHIHGEVQGLVNRQWAAGCGSVTADFGPFHPSVAGWVRVDLQHGNHVDDGLGGCDNVSAYCQAPPPGHTLSTSSSCLGFASSVPRARGARSASRSRPALSAENLKMTSRTGVPQVTVKGPSGTFTTPAAGGPGGRLPFLSGTDAAEHGLVVAIVKPRPGVYTITPVPGSPAIGTVLEAHPLGSRHIQARVTGRGSLRTLHYSVRTAPGQRVRFVERAKGRRADHRHDGEGEGHHPVALAGRPDAQAADRGRRPPRVERRRRRKRWPATPRRAPSRRGAPDGCACAGGETSCPSRGVRRSTRPATRSRSADGRAACPLRALGASPQRAHHPVFPESR